MTYVDKYQEPAVLIHERIMLNEKKAMKLNLTMKVSTNLAKAFITTSEEGEVQDCAGGLPLHDSSANLSSNAGIPQVLDGKLVKVSFGSSFLRLPFEKRAFIVFLVHFVEKLKLTSP